MDGVLASHQRETFKEVEEVMNWNRDIGKVVTEKMAVTGDGLVMTVMKEQAPHFGKEVL